MSWKTLNQSIISCDKCPRLREYCQQVAEQKRRAFTTEEYWGRPIPNFGDPKAGLLIVGLAPAAHGGNRTGRIFTGDRSGDWLYRALHKAGFANQAHSVSVDDGLKLTGAAITAVCHCAPPDNKPTVDEIANCQEWLEATVDLLPVQVFLALGQIGWQAVVRLARRRKWFTGAAPRFGHAAKAQIGQDCWLVGSYHPSQQNTFTGRLTEEMLDDAVMTAKSLLAH
jgi:uracil-DNA glycosylase family 4